MKQEEKIEQMQKEIAHLRKVLGTLIYWLPGGLAQAHAEDLLKILKEDN